MSHAHAIIEVGKALKEDMTKSFIIKEDELEDMNLGQPGDPKLIHISVMLEVRTLLLKFQDIFSWH